jgi:hypothetical protein
MVRAFVVRRMRGTERGFSNPPVDSGLADRNVRPPSACRNGGPLALGAVGGDCRGMLRHRLEFRAAGGTGEGDDVADIADACEEHEEAFEAHAVASVRD